MFVVSFAVQKLVSLLRSHLLIFVFISTSESSSHPEEVQRDPALTPRLKLAEDSVLRANCENNHHSGSLFTSMAASQIKSLPFYAIFFLIYKAKK